MSATGMSLTHGIVLLLLAAATCTQAAGLRKLLDEPTWKKRYEATTQADAYSSAEGQNPGGAGDAFTWNEAESSSTSNYNGVYYAAGQKVVEAGDLAKAGWSGAYSKNDADAGTTSAVSALLDSEFATQRGTHTVSGTYEGARAVAGSGSNFGMSNDPGSVATWTMDSYSQTAEKNTEVGDKRRSVAFTNIAPQSTAQSGIGSGPAAIATGWQVSSAARSHRDKVPPTTVGSRDSSDALQSSIYGTTTAPAATGATTEMGRRLSRETRSENRPQGAVPKKKGTVTSTKRVADVRKAHGSVVGKRQLLHR